VADIVFIADTQVAVNSPVSLIWRCRTSKYLFMQNVMSGSWAQGASWVRAMLAIMAISSAWADSPVFRHDALEETAQSV
jgi:hypothetical protein